MLTTWDRRDGDTAERPNPLACAGGTDPDALAAFARTAADADWAALLRALPGAGDRADLLALDVLPGAAAALGRDWANDRISFVDVSIASARLHAALRRLGAAAAQAATGPAVPILVPLWEQHVLAAALAADRICRGGRRAVVLAGLRPERVAALPVLRDAPAVLLSATDRPARQRLDDDIGALKTHLPAGTHIAVGGPGFGSSHVFLHGRGEAVLTPNDPVAALRACGIQLTVPTPARHEEP